MHKSLVVLAMISVFALLTGGLDRVTANEIPSASSPADVEIQGFHLISEDQGWLLLDQQLYWTGDGGRNWNPITPAKLDSYVIQAVSFRDSQDGWLVLAEPDRVNSLAMATTADGGKNWADHPFSLFGAGDADSSDAAFDLYRLDAQTAWLIVRRATSSNFSNGALFKTTDAGETWDRQSIPIAGPVYFLTRDLGWTAGGPMGDRLYRSRDGGSSWEAQPVLPSDVKPATRQFLGPRFMDSSNGILPIMLGEGRDTRIRFYRTGDSGQTWSLDAVAPPISGIDELDMATLTTGWGKRQTGTCSSPRSNGKPADCHTQTQLLRTTNGGATWQPLVLPKPTRSTRTANPTPAPPSSSKTTPRAVAMNSARYTQIMTGQGFDKCEVASLSSLQEWWTNSPYQAVNLYIGGAARACSNLALTAGYLAQIRSQGWKFIPTWVGPQAPCNSYNSVFSYDTATAFNQGMAEANAALQVAANLKLTDSTKSGTVIYYDLEWYDSTNTACKSAVNSFIAGWSAQLQSTGNIAGAYGAASEVSDWANISAPPDVLWMARWLTPFQYRSNVTVWDVSSVSNSLWVNHQRLYQYAGGHNETWGSVTLNVDSSVIDGVVSTTFLDLPNHSYLPNIQK